MSFRLTSANLPRGIVPVVQMPFDVAGRIDFGSLGRLVEDAIHAGVGGLLAPAVASEVSCLSGEERRAVVHEIAAVARGRAPLVVGASASDPATCRAMGELAESVGAAAWLVAVPAELYADPRRVVSFFEEVGGGCSLPLVLQDFEPGGPGLGLDVLRQIRDAVPALAGAKIETVPAGPKYTAVREAFGEDFYIAGGWAVPQMIEALDRGVDAMIPESSMVRVYAAILRLYRAGDRGAAQGLFRRLLPVLAYTNQELLTSIAFFKRLLVRRRIFDTETMRMAGFRWDRYNEAIAEELIELYLELESEVHRCC